MSAATILVADDDAAIRTVLNQALSRAGYDVRITSNAATLWRWISAGEGDLVITDVVMPDENAFDLLPRIKRLRPELPVLVMSAQNTFMTAIKASEKGAYDYLPKPFDLKELIGIVGRALSEPKRKTPRQEDDGQDGMPLVGRSAAMQEIYRVLARLMQTDLTLMITGESGTGKELVARALHDYGKRRNGPFVAINMAAIPRDLIESELFGHEKGAFTGAQARSTGRFEQAEGRHALPRRNRRYADGCADAAAARAAAGRIHHRRRPHADPYRCPHRRRDQQGSEAGDQQQGLFREDLYYRLNVVPLRLPPLRERAEDITDLVRHFVQMTEKEGMAPKRFDNEALEVMKSYGWPGNVRELENFVRRLTALYPQDVITREIADAELKPDSAASPAEKADARSGSVSISQAVEENMRSYFAEFGDNLPPPGLYDRVLAEMEYPLILAALTATRGNQIKAADLLGLNRNTLRKKIRELGVTVYRSARMA
jgi:two-component system nitrogen regulation response regulator GlnG